MKMFRKRRIEIVVQEVRDYFFGERDDVGLTQLYSTALERTDSTMFLMTSEGTREYLNESIAGRLV